MARRFYTDNEKVLACEIIARYGGEVSKEALASIRDALEAPHLNKSTVHRWWQSQSVATESQPIKKEVATLINRKLDDMFEEIARRMLLRASEDDVIASMKGRDLIISAATAVDKMRLLRDMPTEIIQLLPGLQQALATLGMSASDMINAIIAEAAARRAYDEYDTG